MTHGIDCPKEPHVRSGYLHSPTHDAPYDVDGVAYCGRCHFALDAAELAAARGLSQQPTREEGEAKCPNVCAGLTIDARSTDEGSDAAQTFNPDAAATPRTDAAIYTREEYGDWGAAERRNFVFPDFARTLERELSAETARREQAERERALVCTPLRHKSEGRIFFTDEDLGRKVREVWVAWAKKQENPKPSWLVDWDNLPESDKQVDRLIGAALLFTAMNWCDTENVKLDAENDQLRASLATSEAQRAYLTREIELLKATWESDKPLPEDAEIAAAHPLETKDFATHEEAARLVSHRYSKWGLVDLVNWILAHRAQAEAKVRNLSEALENSKQARVGHIESLKERDEGIKQLRSALTTERRAREQAEADAAAMRGAVTHWMSEYENNLEASDKWIKWCEEQDPKDTHGMNFHQGMRSGVVHHQIALYKLIECCKSTDTGKPLLARLEKAEADVERLREVLELVRNDGMLAVHSHWDMSMRSGVGCPICIKQREVSAAIRTALAAMSTEETP